jgi:hypothetical protein
MGIEESILRPEMLNGWGNLKKIFRRDATGSPVNSSSSPDFARYTYKCATDAHLAE